MPRLAPRGNKSARILHTNVPSELARGKPSRCRAAAGDPATIPVLRSLVHLKLVFVSGVLHAELGHTAAGQVPIGGTRGIWSIWARAEATHRSRRAPECRRLMSTANCLLRESAIGFRDDGGVS